MIISVGCILHMFCGMAALKVQNITQGRVGSIIALDV